MSCINNCQHERHQKYLHVFKVKNQYEMEPIVICQVMAEYLMDSEILSNNTEDRLFFLNLLLDTIF